MRNEVRQFNLSTGAEKLSSLKYILIISLTAALLVFAIVRYGFSAGIGMVVAPLFIFYLFQVFRKPITGFYSAIVLDFFLLGAARYLPVDLTIGPAMDFVLILTYVSVFFNAFYEGINWKPAKKDITLLAAIWFGFTVLQFFNPEIHSRTAYFAGVRGISFYMMLTIPLVLLLITDMRKVDVFFMIWGGLSILGSLKGILQITVGVDPWEQAWLDNFGAPMHIIFGQLRAFSFYSDAGQFGANQAYSAVMATILVFAEKTIRKRVFFLFVALLGFMGMFLSGTRGAMSIPLAGFFLFFVLNKNVRILICGLVLLVMVVLFFKMTWVGQSNQYIRRMRSAFNFNDPSLQVRLENQQRLKTYLATRPFGAGIGQSGIRAKIYTPDSVLSNIPTDSWYVMIWVEQGIPGLALHLFILLYILIKASYLIMFRIRDHVVKMKMSALAAGMFGVMIASYGNAVLGSMPTSLLIYTSMALMLNAKKLDDQDPATEPNVSSTDEDLIENQDQ